jgi:hypothetical protein
MWEDSDYCWVVLCKNHWFHVRRNLFSSHRIALGETDAVAPLPPLDDLFTVRCDECGKEYLYKPSEVRRYEQELPESFVPHPLFRLGGDRRRSRRSLQSVRLIVRGESGEKAAFEEKTFATSLSSHGALLILSAAVEPGQTLFLLNPRNQTEIEGRVVRFGPPYRELPQVGVEFVRPASEFWSGEAHVEKHGSSQ